MRVEMRTAPQPSGGPPSGPAPAAKVPLPPLCPWRLVSPPETDDFPRAERGWTKELPIAMTYQDDKKEGLHVLSALVENEFGVLARIAGLFAARGFNIESLTVGPTHDHTISRMTILVKGSSTVIEQVKKQLNKLIEVITVQDLTETGNFITRELMLCKVNCNPKNRVEIMKIGELFRAKAIDFTPGSLTFELVGSAEKADNFLIFLHPYGIAELARSGVVGMNRGSGGLQSQLQKKLASRVEEPTREEPEPV